MTQNNSPEPDNHFNFDELVSDLREDFDVAEKVEIPKESKQPQPGKEVRLGRKLPQWAYYSIFGIAGLVALIAVFSLSSAKEQPAATANNPNTVPVVTTGEFVAPPFFDVPPTPTAIPLPSTPTIESLPPAEDLLAPEPTLWPDPPEATPIPEPEG